MKNVATSTLLAATLVVFAANAEAGVCWVDNYTNSFGSPLNIGGAPMNGTLCGHTVYGSGAGGCVIPASGNFYASNNSDCLTLGSGVTLSASSIGGATIRCANDQAPCGKAISISNGNGSGNTKVENISISGCFSYGIYGSIANAHSVTETSIGLGGGTNCPTNLQSTGIGGIGTVNRAVVGGAYIGLQEGSKTVNDSIVTENTYGAAGGGGGLMDNVHIYNNDVAFIKGSGAGNTHIRGSAIATVDEGSCSLCYTSPGCGGESNCNIDFTGPTPSALNYSIYP